jgi:uncharacterized damage-inducible protein DinB
MNPEARTIADFLERLARDLIAELQDLPDEVLNRPLPWADANTLFALATHTVGMGEFWVLTLVGGQKIARNRAAEFQAQGRGAELIRRIEQWSAACRVLLDQLPDAQLNDLAQPPAEFLATGGFGDAPLTQRACLLHVIEHSATHLGQIQLTRQFLLSA